MLAALSLSLSFSVLSLSLSVSLSLSSCLSLSERSALFRASRVGLRVVTSRLARRLTAGIRECGRGLVGGV